MFPPTLYLSDSDDVDGVIVRADSVGDDSDLGFRSDSNHDTSAFPTGKIGGSKHRLPICHRCGMEFGFSEDEPEIDSEDGDDFDHSALQLKPAARFKVPKSPLGVSPDALFEHRYHASGFRSIRRGKDTECLVYTDGSCLSKGSTGAQGGCGVLYSAKSAGPSHAGQVSIHLEAEGPHGTGRPPQTCNRADLRAVLLALELRNWAHDGFESIVIASDSDYVCKGLTTWCRRWVANGWQKYHGGDVANQDLWKAILERIAVLKERGTKVQLWRIPHGWNREANKLARQGAKEPQRETYERVRLSDLGIHDGVADIVLVAKDE